MPFAPSPDQILHDLARVRAEAPTWALLAPRLEVRVGSRSARVAEALHLRRDPVEALTDVIPLGPRLGLDVVARVGARRVGVGPLLRERQVPLALGVRVALQDPQRWLRPGGGGEPGRAYLSALEQFPGVAAVDVHDGAQLAGLLLPPERLLPGGEPVVLPLSPARLLVTDARSIEGLRTLLAVAEGARDAPDVVCAQLHARVESAPGDFSWGPWRPPADHPLRSWLHRIRILQDYLDDQRTLKGWQKARPDLHTAALRLAADPQATGRMVSVARWSRQPCSLPAADCFEVEGPDGRRVRVWVDSMLDVLSSETRPLPGAWPPRFVATGGVSREGWARVQAAASVA